MTLQAPLPKYYQIQEILRERIAPEAEGTPLPSETELCETYNVSRITIRKALTKLVQEGYLYRIQGKGTFISKPKIIQKARERFVHQITGFYGEMTSRGYIIQTQVVDQSIVQPPKDVTEKLSLSIGERVISIERVRFVDHVPNHIVKTFLPYALFPGMESVDLSEGSLYTHLREKYNAHLHRARLIVEVDTCSNMEAKLLNVKPRSPLLVVHSTVFDPNEHPIIYGFSRLRDDLSQVEFEVVSQSPEDN